MFIFCGIVIAVVIVWAWLVAGLVKLIYTPIGQVKFIHLKLPSVDLIWFVVVANKIFCEDDVFEKGKFKF